MNTENTPNKDTENTKTEEEIKKRNRRKNCFSKKREK